MYLILKLKKTSQVQVFILRSNQSDNDANREQLMDSSSSDNVSSSLHKPNEISEEPLSDILSFNDIGLLINEAMTVSEIENVLLGLKDNDKYNLLRNHFIPDSTYNFPITFSHSRKRKFTLAHLPLFPWLVYSKSLDAAFCKYCSIFCKNRQNLGILVNKPFRDWKHSLQRFNSHNLCEYHTKCMSSGEELIYRIENLEKAFT